jgi:hypothetical protein
VDARSTDAECPGYPFEFKFGQAVAVDHEPRPPQPLALAP